MYTHGKILVGKNDTTEAVILPAMANRHGLITGATGTGKTITLKVLAESFSTAGVPVFMVDVKGDLAGTAFTGEDNDGVRSRVTKLGLTDFHYDRFPVVFLDTYGVNGHPVRATLESLGHRLLAKMLDLSDAQDSVLAIIYKIAADEGKKLNDLGDLQSMLTYVGSRRADYATAYGNIAPQTLTTIQRGIVELTQETRGDFFGTPEYRYTDLRALDPDTGYGRVTILDAQQLFGQPSSYVAMVLWLLNQLYDNLPEVGDLDKPRLVFFFDEAHLIFSEMPKVVIDHLIKIVKLIRSKGVGLYFISQSPADIPEAVLSQLGNKIQHALHAYTPREQTAIKAAADGLRANPEFDTKTAIQQLGTGEALVSFIDERGEPTMVQKVTVLPPQSQMGAIDQSARQRIINSSPLAGIYDRATNEISAEEMNTEILQQEEAAREAAARAAEQAKREAEAAKLAAEQAKAQEKAAKEEEKRLAAEARAREKAAREAERQAAAKQREQEKAAREAERARKNSLGYKLGKKVVNKTVNKVIDKGLNSVMKSLFK